MPPTAVHVSVDFAAPGAAIPPALQWRPSTPQEVRLVDGEGLLVRPSPNTDQWMRTHYGFENRNAQQLGVRVTGDFVATTRVTLHSRLQYDQAGLFVFRDDDTWLKTSVEFIPGGAHKLGAVVTQGGFSDWSTAPIATDGALTLQFRVARLGEALLVHTRPSDDAPWFLARLARLPVDPAAEPGVVVGLYACNPTGDGGHAVFRSLEVRPPREGEVTLH